MKMSLAGRILLVLLLMCTTLTLISGNAEAAGQDITPTFCDDPGETPPCVIEWTLSSRFVDPEVALVYSGEDNFVPSGSHTEGGLQRPAHELTTLIHLPEGYDGELRFPVLYLLHGQGRSPRDWLGECGICPDFRPLLRQLPAVVVMPQGGAFSLYSNWWNGGRGDPAVSGWERHHLDELIPAVEANLQVRAGRRWRSIFGHSMGGYGAIRYAAQCPECFGSVGSLSGGPLDNEDPLMPAFCGASVGLNVGGFGTNAARDDNNSCEDVWGLPTDFYWRGHNPLNLIRNLRNTRVYVAHGNVSGDPTGFSEPPADQEAWLALMNERWVQAARAEGVNIEYKPRPGTHRPVYTYEDLRDAIENWGIFGRVNESTTSWSFKTVSQHGRMWGLRYGFSASLDDIAVFERSGDVLTGVGRGTVTLSTNRGHVFTVPLPFRVSLPTGRAL